MQYGNIDGLYEGDKEENVMPSVELIEYERISYIKEMEAYLSNLKSMSKAEAKKIAHENLVKSQIIEENGEFTERYQFARMSTQKKR